MNDGPRVTNFATNRLTVRYWGPAIFDPARHTQLQRDLVGLLTPAVLADLPPSMQLGEGPDRMAQWIAARASESEVFLVESPRSGELSGLLILAREPMPSPEPRESLHIGYLFKEADWGKGYASEVVTGLVSAISGDGPTRLIGGVARSNPASARVLEKAGFRRERSQPPSEMDTYVYHAGHRRDLE